MRQIKFRFWDKLRDSFRYDLFIHEDKLFDIYNDHGGMFSSGLVKDDVTTRFITQQYTGVKDSEGTEIYEGDILEIINGSSRALVDFNNDNYGNVLGWNLLELEHKNNGDWIKNVKEDGVYPAVEHYYGESPSSYWKIIGHIYMMGENYEQ